MEKTAIFRVSGGLRAVIGAVALLSIEPSFALTNLNLPGACSSLSACSFVPLGSKVTEFGHLSEFYAGRNPITGAPLYRREVRDYGGLLVQIENVEKHGTEESPLWSSVIHAGVDLKDSKKMFIKVWTAPVSTPDGLNGTNWSISVLQTNPPTFSTYCSTQYVNGNYSQVCNEVMVMPSSYAQSEFVVSASSVVSRYVSPYGYYSSPYPPFNCTLDAAVAWLKGSQPFRAATYALTGDAPLPYLARLAAGQ